MDDAALAVLLDALGQSSDHGSNFDIDFKGKNTDPFAASDVMREDPFRGRYPYEKQPELRSARPTVWPNEMWFEENLGITDPNILRRYGQAQSALYSLLDGVTMGIPNALAKRFAPEAVQGVEDVKSHNPLTSLAANLLGIAGGPTQSVVRAAGDALARRGGSLYGQAALDAGSAAAVFGAPSLIEGEAGVGAPYTMNAAAGAASANRLLGDVAAKTIPGRVAVGAAGGAMSQFPSSYVNSSFADAAIGALMGGVLGAKAPRQSHVQREGEDGFDALLALGMVPLGLTAASIPAAIDAERKPPKPNSKEWWNQTRQK